MLSSQILRQVWQSRPTTSQILHGFKLEKVDHIKELDITPLLFKHQSTGAEYLHIQKDDDSNNVFCVSFRTTPKNSSGVAHILEHLALCGSKKYNVRDPFMKMTTRSLATFMNAMTGPDCTFYPFSTQNKKDFENLMRVYTDAAFFPRLKHVNFRQEGWRLEHEVPDKKDTPIIIRGVVYNEMKGVFSSSSATYSRHLLNNLFPDTTYKYESGGDPECIPTLTNEELKKFHQVHYHPTNAKFFTYGNFPVEDHLKLTNELVLSKFSENSQAREGSIVQDQAYWNEPKYVNITCPPDPMIATPDKQITTSISYLFPTQNTNYSDIFSLQLLSTLLTDGPNAPFYKNLIESGLGSDYSPSTGFCMYTKQPFMSVGLQNLHIDDVGKVHTIIEKTLQETAKEGFAQERIEAVLHDIELGLKHVPENFGLRLVMNLIPFWNHDGDAIEYFKVNKYVEEFKRAIEADKNYWSNLIERNFLKNKHKLVLTMSPDTEFEDKRKDRERQILESKLEQLDDVGKQTVLYEGMELMKMQDAIVDSTILPCLEPSKDISQELSHRNNLDFDTHHGVRIQLSTQPTNEVIYFRALTDVGGKLQDSDLIDYLPLFCDVVTKLGAGEYSRQQLAQEAQLRTGGLGASLLLNPSLNEFDVHKNEVCISSHCLRRNVGKMFHLWFNIFKKVNFDDNKDYLRQLIMASAADLSDSIPHSGQMYAMKRSAMNLSKLASVDERLSGLDYVARMKDMASSEAVDLIAEKLKTIATIALNPSNMRCAINTDSNSMQSAVVELKRFIEELQPYCSAADGKLRVFEPPQYERTKVEDMHFPFASHYVAKSLIAVPRLHQDFAKLTIMSKLISSKYLLREVREKGGAYGAKLRISNTGILSFFSARDPNTTKTIERFDESCKWAVDGEEYTEKDVEECKLGVFQDVDKPIEPGRRGMNYFLIGETDAMRQDYRNRLLNVSKEDIAKVAKKYLRQKQFGTFIL